MQASRPIRYCAVLTGVWLIASGLVASGAAAATPALVIDAESGKVLYAERATDPWYPASITKLMTTYVALSAVREGRVSLDTPLTVSDLAHAMPPSKMGFPPGTEITLDNALKIIMVKSANDIALAIAEGVGGSVEGFADMMNAAAQRLGMRESRFVNPHGLPDDRQQTSARDMAILGRALFREFPEHAGYFQIGAIKFGRRVMNNHNGLMGRYPGADGMKTGFICASGFNVVASATRNGRRLITVVMGSPSAAERTIRAAALFDQGFTSWGLGATTVDQLPPSALAGPPNLRPYICERRGPMPAEEEAPPATAQTDDSGRVVTALAYAAAGSTPGPRPQLGPRMRFEPIMVWTGRTPPAALAARSDPKEKASESAKAAGPARAATQAPSRALAKSKPPKPASTARAKAEAPAAQAFMGTQPKSILDDGTGAKALIQPSAALGPSPSADRPRVGAAPALPKPVAAKPVTTKPATPKATAAKAGKPAPAQAAGTKPASAKTGVKADAKIGAKPGVKTGGVKTGAKPDRKPAAQASERKPQVAAETKPAKPKPQAE